jgi:hypothetical protein
MRQKRFEESQARRPAQGGPSPQEKQSNSTSTMAVAQEIDIIYGLLP